ncbi:hypothetical protein NUW54_g5000 [Trametes sanguinea]|uniref:Uncharacterized protein n=1 Tax=Trametes sanguinea TaxID=158606 RepID=A0ACC1PWH1_9APHY|nr:hypothetical protein NUW54_g5000 [Trametes sanguinea]
MSGLHPIGYADQPLTVAASQVAIHNLQITLSPLYLSLLALVYGTYQYPCSGLRGESIAAYGAPEYSGLAGRLRASLPCSYPYEYAEPNTGPVQCTSGIGCGSTPNFELYLLEYPPLFLYSYEAFQDELRTNFRPYDTTRAAEHNLENLWMTENQRIAKYITQFNWLATQVRWGTTALRCQFYKGLPDCLKDRISKVGKPKMLKGLRNLAHSKSGNSDTKSSAPQKSSLNSGSPYSDKLGKDGKLTQEERQCWFANNLCLFCGGPGHTADLILRLNVSALSDPSSFVVSLYSETVLTPFLALIDSGSSHCFIDSDFVNKHRIPASDTPPLWLQLFDGNSGSSRAYSAYSNSKLPKVCPPDLSLVNTAVFMHACKMSGSESYTLNLSATSVQGQAAFMSKSPPDLTRVLPEYHKFVDVFSKTKADILLEHHPYNPKITLEEGATPPLGPIYLLLKLELDMLWEYIQENLRSGFIWPLDSPCGAPVLFVKKKDGSLWLCVDYHGFNKITCKDRYLLPLILDLLDAPRKAWIYTKIDLRHTYNLHHFTDKCEFHEESVKYLSYILSCDGLTMAGSKVKAILNWPEPRKVHDIQSFLGFANFYWRFIHNYSKIILPLTGLNQKGVPGNFDQKCRNSFNALKKAFTSTPVLHHWVQTARSPYYAITGILSITSHSSELHPVVFHSRTLSGVELNYNTHNKELLAIFKAFKTWRHYLKGSATPIDVVTDHKNLEYFVTTKLLTQRQAWWLEYLSQFNLIMQICPGQLRAKPHTLTRCWDVYPKEGDSDYSIINPHNFRPVFTQKQLASSLCTTVLCYPVLQA